jgi:hypothetical protein
MSEHVHEWKKIPSRHRWRCACGMIAFEGPQRRATGAERTIEFIVWDETHEDERTRTHGVRKVMHRGVLTPLRSIPWGELLRRIPEERFTPEIERYLARRLGKVRRP